MTKLKRKLAFILHKAVELIDQNPVEGWFENLFKSRKQLLLVGIVAILSIQSFYYFLPVSMDVSYRRGDATGFNHMWAEKFIYHYYYNDLFPLVTRAQEFEYSEEGARENLYEKSDSLLTEYKHWSRFGESARIWLYMPYAWVTQSPKDPQINFTNYLVLSLSLVFLFYTFWKRKLSFIGLLLAIIIGCSPFMVYEVYCRNNIFGLMAAYAVLLTALYLPFFKEEFKIKQLFIPLLAGGMAGIFYHIRAESIALLISPLLIVWLNKKIKWQHSLSLTMILLGSFYLTNQRVKDYFEGLREETVNKVEELGGTPFKGGETLVHPLWHPLYCGLGDFDTQYGHVLHDTAAYRFALPILRERTGEPLVYPGRTKYEMGDYYDADSLYYKKVETIPGYGELVKDLFLQDIGNDPIWYLGILLKRIEKFFFHLSPLGISLYESVIPIPFHGLLVVLLIGVLGWYRKWFWLKLILFTMPLGISVIAIFYLDNNSYQSIFHFFAFCIFAYSLIGLFMDRKQLNTSS